MRYTSNVFLLYDSDEAGLKATFRCGLELLRHGMSVRVVTLPDGEDPDTFVRRTAPSALERHLSGAMDLFERQVQILERHGWFADLHRKRRAVDKLLPTIRAAADPVTRELYLGRLGELTGIDRAALQREADAPTSGSGTRGVRPNGSGATQAADGGRERAGPPGQPSPPPAEQADRPWTPRGRGAAGRRGGRGGRGGRWRDDGPPEFVDASRPRPGEHPARRAERALVLAMLHREGYIESVAQRFEPERFRDPVYAEIYALLVERGEAGDAAELAEALSPEAVKELQQLLSARDELTVPHVIVEDSLAKLRYFELTEQIEEVRRQLMRADGDERTAFEEERGRLVEERKALGLRGNWARALGT